MQWYCNQWYVPWKDVDGTLFKNNDDDDDVSPLQPKALLTSELYWHLGKDYERTQNGKLHPIAWKGFLKIVNFV